jgi:NAD(P)-dependent dehydrogenase (short-subunit alcohol dehydrogenase family)
MAVDFADWNIRVNGVAPGWVHTDMANDYLPPKGQPLLGVGIMPRAGDPEEIADAIAFLASERCGFMTGQMITVDGGQMAVSPETTAAGADS